MENETREVSLTCPICKKKNTIQVPEKVFEQKQFGSIKIQVPPGAVCPDHQFIVFLDPKGLVRGYERIDILMGDKSTKAIEEAEEGIERKLSINILVNKLGLYGVFSILHAKLFGYPSYIIREGVTEEFTKKINTFFNELTKNEYSNPQDIEFLDLTDYNEVELEREDALLIDSHNNIMQTPWNEKLKLEEQFIQKALEIINPGEQKVIIQQNIKSFIKEVKHTIRILESVKQIYDKDLISQLEKDLKLSNVSSFRLNLIREFIIANISEDLGKKIKNKVKDFLGSL
ncbi:MAG: hypothetical protein EU541_08545 [Promethearchaeota archaeon]|nr:MAG: hypothetical protein EU541_08545 [Candidatus Lokiarchaeota archaeon]